mgnify:CR=1 FL=1
MFKIISKCSDEIGLECYVIGGFVRDLFLGSRKSKDIDILIIGDGIEIAKKVCLSIEGVGSSLRRMYVYFNIKESKYKKISLLLDAVRLSNN